MAEEKNPFVLERYSNKNQAYDARRFQILDLIPSGIPSLTPYMPIIKKYKKKKLTESVIEEIKIKIEAVKNDQD